MKTPKNTKYRKAFKGKVKGHSTRGNTIHFGQFGLIALENGRITAQQIEAFRRAVVRRLKRTGNLWIRIFPDIPVTRKPSEVRMGKGKGSVDRWICRVHKDRVLFELAGIPEVIAQKAFKLGAAKLPIRTKWIKV